MRVPKWRGLLLPLVALTLGSAGPASAAPEGTMIWGVHITLASRWLDPAETEGIITPFMVLYGLHDALVKPMPAGLNTPSLAESWTESKDGLTYECSRRGAAGTACPGLAHDGRMTALPVVCVSKSL